jgi:hypothetical protein
MTRTRWWGWCPVLLGLLMAAPAPAAEESPLAQVPAKAPVVVSVRGVKRTMDRLVTMIKNAMPDLGPVVQTKVADFMKKGLFEGRELKGLKDDGPIFLALLGLPQGEDEDGPEMVVIARVTDYKAFRDNLMTEDERKDLKEDKAGYQVATVNGKELYFVHRGDYAFITPAKKAAAGFVKDAKAKGLDRVLPRETAHKLLEADFAAYADLATISKAYGKQIKTGKELVGDFLERAPDAGILSKEQAEMFQGLSGAVFQALEDGRAVLLTGEFRPAGVALDLDLSFAAHSKSDAFLKMFKPSPLAGLKALPAGFTTFSACDFGPQAYKAFHPILKSLAAGPETEEGKPQDKTIKEAMDDLLAARPRRYVSASNMSGGTGFQVWEFADPAKGLAAQLKLMKALKKGGEYQFTSIKDEPVVKADAETYRDARFHYASLKWDLDKMAENTPGGEEMVKILKKMFGERMNLWFGLVDQRYVQVAAPDWKAAKKVLDDYFDKKNVIGGDKHKGFAQARANLPREATFVYLTQAGSLASFCGELIYGIVKGQGLPFNLSPPGKLSKKIQPSYLGVAMTLQAGQARFSVWLPGAAARDFRTVFEPMFKDLDD